MQHRIAPARTSFILAVIRVSEPRIDRGFQSVKLGGKIRLFFITNIRARIGKYRLIINNLRKYVLRTYNTRGCVYLLHTALIPKLLICGSTLIEYFLVYAESTRSFQICLIFSVDEQSIF